MNPKVLFHEIDLVQTNNKFPDKYDLILCMNTLEHLKNVSKAIENISLLGKDGVRIYIKMPCKPALVSKLN